MRNYAIKQSLREVSNFGNFQGSRPTRLAPSPLALYLEDPPARRDHPGLWECILPGSDLFISLQTYIHTLDDNMTQGYRV